MAKRLTVVVSQGQSSHPDKRRLEEDLVTQLIQEPGIDVLVIPHLYDLKGDGTGMLALQGVGGDMVVLSWLYERAARWTLDRQGIRGLPGQTTLAERDEGGDEEGDEDEDPSADESAAAPGDEKQRVADQRTVPQRRIYCLELKVAATAAPVVAEIRRIAAESRQQLVSLNTWLGGQASGSKLERFLHPTNSTALPLTSAERPAPAAVQPLAPATRIEEDPERRWYPVIDFSRCTNCMECIDFCLFGVYGIDRTETIVVEQPDNCRKGCPACSRVCPENAILFPQHKTPAIAGAPVGLVNLKIDLSRLFGAPTDGRSALEVAALERDEQLLLAGRDAVGLSQGIPKRQTAAERQAAPKDDLDSLLDALDQADL